MTIIRYLKKIALMDKNKRVWYLDVDQIYRVFRLGYFFYKCPLAFKLGTLRVQR